MIRELFSSFLTRRGAAATRMFGSDGVMVNGNVMMFEWKGSLVLRLSETDGPKALALPGADYFNPMASGRPSKNWVAIPAAAIDRRVLPLADAAFAFASSLPPKSAKVKAATPAKAKAAKPKPVPVKKASVKKSATAKAASKSPGKAVKKAAPKKKVAAKKKKRT